MSKTRSIGISIPRIDGISKATGKATYVTDLKRPGMLYGKILRSDRPHARIVHIDTGEALSLPGVKAVVTGRDAPDIRYGVLLQDRYVLAKDRVRYIGEPIAAVAAVSERIAEKAIRLIRVAYQDLKPVYTVEAALDDSAPLLHPDLRGYRGPEVYISCGNVCADARLSVGDVAQGFADSDLIFEDTYRTPAIHQAYLEPLACLAELDSDGRLVVWSGSQLLSPTHERIAAALNMPMTQVRVIPLTMGGGFGGKLLVHIEEICALLALNAGKPVKLCLSREEDIFIGHARPPYTIFLRTGVRKDGSIIAREADILTNVGAYSDYAVATSQVALCYTMGVYRIPNLSARARAVYTNNPDFGCMRGFGAIEIGYANECHLDVIARGLGMDPVALRYKNLAQEGDPRATGQGLHGVSSKELMDIAIEKSGYHQKKGRLGPYRGIGIAHAIISTGVLSSSAIVHVLGDGSVNLQTGIVDIGTGTHTALCQIAAEVFGVDISQVHMSSPDSDHSPYDAGSFASRTLFDAGRAVLMAAKDARDQLIDIAAGMLDCQRQDVSWEGGKAYRTGAQTERLSMAELSEYSKGVLDGPIIGRGALLSNRPFERLPGEGYFEYPSCEYLFATHVAEVEVDPDTGKCKVLNYTASHDGGLIVNPRGFEGQIEGGVVQGIGYALLEHLVIEEGRIANPSFLDYHLPTAMDIPEINIFSIESKSTKGPFGAKGIGEPPIMPPMPAIANAIFDAVGVQVKELPITAERLFFAMREKREDTA